MALVVLLRGINVGGHGILRPRILAKKLSLYDAVSVGAAGTLVVRNPGPRSEFLSHLRLELPPETVVAACDSRALMRLERQIPFNDEPRRADLVQFVTVLSSAAKRKVPVPLHIPKDGEWFVRIIGARGRLVYGVYRRHMKTIGSLGQIDEIFGAPATTRSWSTMLAVLRILKPD